MGRLGGFKFRRQSPIGPYIADFHCPECRLVVEIDGATHPFKGKYELQRQQYFIYAGFVALHFSNHEIFNHLESVCSQIKEACLEAREKQARNTTSEPAEPA
jgi:very-short-patch-repair endonuclease